MKTPICDFMQAYADSDALRLHMPGHKGTGKIEQLDITEIDGADSLYEASGIIRESEENASRLFGTQTFYSTEGCSQCIRAMLYLTALYAKSKGRRPLIAAARNVHKSFLSAVALLDVDVLWLYPQNQTGYLSCPLSVEDVEQAFSQAPRMPDAVYLTSPDYLGTVAQVEAIGQVCHRNGALLLVDNAHGAYLRFLQPSMHPMDLGADLCCDSAHKTLPVLTGGAYLHIGDDAPAMLQKQAKNALMLFGSTSPSYLILRSLDAANAYLDDGYSAKLAEFVAKLQGLKEKLTAHGYCLWGDEPLKLTLMPKNYGYTGKQLAQYLLKQNIVCEFSDPDYLVLMLTPETGERGMKRLEQALLGLPQKPAIAQTPPVFHRCKRELSVRAAMLAPCETVAAEESLGRILAAPGVGCPPAVPIVISGERIDEAALSCFAYYGIDRCTVVI